MCVCVCGCGDLLVKILILEGINTALRSNTGTNPNQPEHLIHINFPPSLQIELRQQLLAFTSPHLTLVPRNSRQPQLPILLQQLIISHAMQRRAEAIPKLCFLSLWGGLLCSLISDNLHYFLIILQYVDTVLQVPGLLDQPISCAEVVV